MSNLVFSCVTCGGSKYKDEGGKRKCLHCGNKYIIENVDESLVSNLTYARNKRQEASFDQARRRYDSIIRETDKDSPALEEAYWGQFLCEQYVIFYRNDKDEAIPSFWNINPSKCEDSANYKKAIEYGKQSGNSENYEKLAKLIETYKEKYIKVRDEKPEGSEIFICFKDSGTTDRNLGYKIYNKFSGKYRIFFSPDSLNSIKGNDYEPYIYHALTTAKVLIVLCSSRESLESKWVHNEWWRFNKFAEGTDKTIIPIMRQGFSASELPDEIRNCQGASEDVDLIATLEKRFAVLFEKDEGIEVHRGKKKISQKNVDRLVAELDCEREDAERALMLMYDNYTDAMEHIQNDPDYKKKLWICAECDTKNTHDKCHNKDCGISKEDSVKLAAERKRAAEQKAERDRIAKRKSAEAKARRAKKAKKVFGCFITIAILAGVGFFTYKIAWPMWVKPVFTVDYLQTVILNVDKTQAVIGESVNLSYTVDPSSPDKVNLGGDAEGDYDAKYIQYWASVNGADAVMIGSNTETLEYKLEQMGEYSLWVEYCGHKNCDGANDIVSERITVTAKGTPISTAADLNKLNNATGNFELTVDIDLSGVDFKPIEGFKGALNGAGYAIKNLTINASNSNVGLFATLEGSVMNLKLENVNITVSGKNEKVGALCGTLTGMVNNCSVSGSVNAEKASYVGGIIGYSENLGDCSNNQFSGKVNGSQYAGGIIGYGKKGTIVDSSVSADIEAESYVGGIGGYLSGTIVNSCKNSGSSVKATKYEIVDGNKYAYLGGFAGYGYDANDCVNEVDIEYSAGGSYVGGILGYQENGNDNDESISANLINKGNIQGADYVGGIIGYSHNSIDCSGWKNENAVISGKNNVGGLVGCSRSFGEFVECETSGSISGEQYVGGVIGKTEFGNIREANVHAEIKGDAYVGCVAGYAHRTGIYDCKNEGSTMSVEGSIIVDGTQYAYVGGFVGWGYTAQNCINKVAINYNGGGIYVGGIIGFSGGCDKNQDILWQNLSNEADINGLGYVGGIIGCMDFAMDDWYYTNKYTLTELKNYGNVKGDSDYVGGVFGRFYVASGGGNNWVYINDPVNEGDVSGNAYVGGIVGYAYKTGNSSFHGSGSASGMFNPISIGIVEGTDKVGVIAGEINFPYENAKIIEEYQYNSDELNHKIIYSDGTYIVEDCREDSCICGRQGENDSEEETVAVMGYEWYPSELRHKKVYSNGTYDMEDCAPSDCVCGRQYATAPDDSDTSDEGTVTIERYKWYTGALRHKVIYSDGTYEMADCSPSDCICGRQYATVPDDSDTSDEGTVTIKGYKWYSGVLRHKVIYSDGTYDMEDCAPSDCICGRQYATIPDEEDNG